MPLTTAPRRSLKVLLAKPRGFCAGVERAIETVERALERYGAPIYVRHEIVHNKRVVQNLRAKGARFVAEVDEVPEDAVTVFSAHGVARRVEERAAGRRLEVIDATCPLVRKVHMEGRRYAEKGFEVVLIGHGGHPEVVGTLGQIPGTVHLVTCLADAEALEPADPQKLAYVTQTTLSVDDTRDIIAGLRRRFPAIVGPDTRDICYATQNRQTAVVWVVGAPNTSNANRLREIGEACGTPSFLVEDATDLDPAWLSEAESVGITAGASAPEELVEELLSRLQTLYVAEIRTLDGVEETVQFRLPEPFAEASA